MQTLLFVVVTSAFLTSPSQVDAGVSLDGVTRKAEESARVVARVAGDLQGRVLGSCVRKGMTTEQVDRILGPGCLCAFACNRSSITWGLWMFLDYGLLVFYGSDKDGVLRVDSVSFAVLSK
jgi:hypothetical protein